MATPYVGQVSAHGRRHDSTSRAFQKDITQPSLGLDLRFEQTYLKSIAPHVRLTTPVPDESEKRGDLVGPQGRRLEIKWARVVWITTRDQVLTPMFQGMIWWVSPLPASRVNLKSLHLCRRRNLQGNSEPVGAIFPWRFRVVLKGWAAI